MALRGSDGSIILTTQVDDTGLRRGLSSMKKLGGTIAKTFLSIAAAATAVTVAITKEAVTAYGEYEQLIGGVVTLYKDAAHKVVKYANDAFYTAGMSANEYMETSISVSAMLIKSVGGDAEKAADIVNMAIIDMSDNVNRMGTDIERVRLAYQAFGRQQYTLLDNLALGYGGTRKEMERLLKDAQAITGVKYDINNLADVYSAIHVIQKQLGITGATAEEAEKTLVGSAKMTKAAWKDLLTSIAGGGDLDRAINNLVFSLTKFMENLVPIIERAFVGLFRVVEKLLPLLVERITVMAIELIPHVIMAVYNITIGAFRGLYEGISAAFSGKASKTISVDLQTGLQGIGQTATDASDSITTIGDATADSAKKAKKALAGFDDLNILSDTNKDVDVGDSISGALANVGSTLLPDDLLSESSALDIPAPVLAMLEDLKKLLEPTFELLENCYKTTVEWAKGVDWTPLFNAVGKLGEKFKILNEEIHLDGEALWSVATLPALEWSIEDLAPEAIEAITHLFSGLATAIHWTREGMTQLFEKCKPIFNWIGGVVVDIVKVFKTMFSGVSETLEKKGWKIGEIFSGIGDIIAAIWKKAEPILSKAWSFISMFLTFLAEQVGPIIGLIIDVLHGLVNFLAGVFTGDWERAMGGIADIFVGVWDFIKSSASSLKGFFSNLLGKIKESISNAFKNWGESIANWWKNDVAPWFTKEKWEELFSKIGESLANAVVGVNGLVDKWKTSFNEWWDNTVAPWLSKERWSELFSNIGEGIDNALHGEDGFVSKWKKSISDWWNNDVLVWFSKEKWSEIGENIKNGIMSGIEGIKTGVKKVINYIIDGFQKLVNGAIDLLNALISGWNKVADATPLLKSMNTIEHIDLSKYKYPMLAQGTVVPPNKQFMAVLGDNTKEHEIVSPLSTMKQAFTEAMIEMGGNFGGGNTEVILEIDGREFGRAVVEQGNRENRRIGTRLVIA